jgi:hypothetical protein
LALEDRQNSARPQRRCVVDVAPGEQDKAGNCPDAVVATMERSGSQAVGLARKPSTSSAS